MKSEDTQLLKNCKCGDSKALQRIYLKYKDELLKLAVTLAIDVPTAEDAVQDVFVRFARSVRQLEIRGNLKHYLAKSVVNRIRNIRRDRYRQAQIDSEQIAQAVDASDPPGDWLIMNEQLRQLRSALAQIPYDQRETISLHTHGGLTFRQIALMQETSVNTVQGRYRYGINKLRQLLNGRLK